MGVQQYAFAVSVQEKAVVSRPSGRPMPCPDSLTAEHIVCRGSEQHACIKPSQCNSPRTCVDAVNRNMLCSGLVSGTANRHISCMVAVSGDCQAMCGVCRFSVKNTSPSTFL